MTGALSRRSLLDLACRAAGAALLVPAASADDCKAARPGREFTDSVGVCINLAGDFYRDQLPRLCSLLSESRIRHIRVAPLPGLQLDRWRALQTIPGLRWHLLASPLTNTVPQLLNLMAELGLDRCSAVEGQNEGDGYFKTQPAARGDWSGTVVAFQRDLYEAVRRVCPAAMLPVVSPTLLDWRPGDVSLIRPAAGFCDVVGLHAYMQHSQEPETDEDYSGLRWYVRNYRDSFKPGAPMMVTETGYTNTTGPGRHGISELASSIYLPRLLLHNFGAGVRRTFLYAFMDAGQDPGDNEHHYGIVRFDGNPKPEYGCIRALLEALADDGVPSRQRRSLRLSFPDAPPGMRRQIFALPYGGVVVALWQPARVWDADRGLDLEPPPTLVSVSAPGALQAEQMTLDSHATWRPVVLAGGRTALPVRARVTLLRLT
jgi:hypothetical protein